MSNQKEPEQSREILSRYLAATGRRRTAERYAVLDSLRSSAGHLSAEQLRAAMLDAGYRVSVATVYSALELLVECGLAARQRFSGSVSLYEYSAPGRRAVSHHHLICTRCGKVTEMRDPDISAMIEAKRFTSFSPQYFTLNIYGICRTCVRRKKRGQDGSNL